VRDIFNILNLIF